MADKKYTFWEWCGISSIASVMVAFGVLMCIPLGLLSAVMRAKVWNWFMVPYFHAPHIGVWLMFAVGLFVGMFRGDSPELKKEYYSASTTARLLTPFIVQTSTFLIAYLLHIWFLKG